MSNQASSNHAPGEQTPPAQPLPGSFYEYAAVDPDAVAVVEPDDAVTTRGVLLRRVNRISNALLARGLELDDRVALLVRNSVEYFDWSLACGQLGLHLVPLNYHLVPDEIAYIVDNSGAKIVAATESLLDVAATALDLVGYQGERVALGGSAPGFTTLSTFLGDAPDAAPSARTNGGAMLYTSGTTGRPKGVLWPARAGVTPEMALAGSRPMFTRRGMSNGGVSLVCGPLYHGAPGAQGLQALHWGQSVVLMDHWDSEHALRLIDRYGVTHAQMAPIHFHRLLQLPVETRERYNVASLRAVTHAGAGCPVDVKHQMMGWFGPVLYEYYAASEGFGTSISPQQWLDHPGSVGHASSDGAEIRVVDEETGDLLPVGEIGKVFLRLPGLGESEYLGDPEKTKESRGADGFRTFGDMGYLDADGWLFLVDRRADMILSGGVNIYPAEIEQVLRTHSDVSDAGVIGIPDTEWGQRVLAIVVPSDGANTDGLVDRLRSHCEAHLAKFKCPREYEVRDELPYTPAGKLLRRVLRDPYWETTRP